MCKAFNCLDNFPFEMPLEVFDAKAITSCSDLPEPVVVETLESLSSRNAIYSGRTRGGKEGYELLQMN
jgi:hypothetical protein